MDRLARVLWTRIHIFKERRWSLVYFGNVWLVLLLYKHCKYYRHGRNIRRWNEWSINVSGVEEIIWMC